MQNLGEFLLFSAAAPPGHFYNFANLKILHSKENPEKKLFCQYTTMLQKKMCMSIEYIRGGLTGINTFCTLKFGEFFLSL